MKSEAWNLVAHTIEHARQEGHSYGVYKVKHEYVADFWVEWNGGLPIIGYTDLSAGSTFHDVTAFALVSFLESCHGL